MTNPVIQQLLDGIELRERQLAEQIGELAVRLREAQAECEALQTTGKTIRAMAADLDLDQPPAPVLPDGAAYQQIMASSTTTVAGSPSRSPSNTRTFVMAVASLTTVVPECSTRARIPAGRAGSRHWPGGSRCSDLHPQRAWRPRGARR